MAGGTSRYKQWTFKRAEATMIETLNPTGMYGAVELVTPEKAAAYIETTPGEWQRNSRKHRVEEYTLAIQSGAWKLTHQGIAFDTNGVLRDGLHRCKAIVSAGLAVSVYVVRNVPADAFLYVDDQLPRSPRDSIRMSGNGEFSSALIAVATNLACFPLRDGETHLRPSREVILKRLDRCSDELEFVERYLGRVRSYTRAARVLVVRALLCGNDKGRIEDWVSIIRTGVTVSGDVHDDTSAITYRNYLMATKTANWRGEIEKYCKGQAALFAFLRRQPLSKLYATPKDLFPLPEWVDQ